MSQIKNSQKLDAVIVTRVLAIGYFYFHDDNGRII
jgi:hypothetical protein